MKYDKIDKRILICIKSNNSAHQGLGIVNQYSTIIVHSANLLC